MQSTTNISTSWYHSILRISVLVFALALVFESGILSSVTQTIAHTAGEQFATAIQATTDNANYDEEVLSPEIARNQSEVKTLTVSPTTTKSTFLLSAIVFILLLLVVLNYILDYLRSKERQPRLS